MKLSILIMAVLASGLLFAGNSLALMAVVDSAVNHASELATEVAQAATGQGPPSSDEVAQAAQDCLESGTTTEVWSASLGVSGTYEGARALCNGARHDLGV